MSTHPVRQPSLPVVLVVVLLAALLFAWTLAVDVPPRFTEAARPAQPVALELPPPWPAHLAADSAPQGMVSSSVVWPPPAPARDEGWCRDRLADALASLPDDPSRTGSPYFFVLSDEPDLDRLPLKETRADVDIAGTVAEVRVSQRYRNDGERTVEAIYLFPASTRAAVHGMRMSVGGRMITAELQERQQAQQAYEEARQEGRTASLLEQHRPNVLQARVANILPGDEVQVELSYTETLDVEEGRFEFVYPTVVGPRYAGAEPLPPASDERWLASPYTRAGEPAFHTFGLDLQVRTAVSLGEVSSPSHELVLTRHGEREAHVSVPASVEAGDRDFVLHYHPGDGEIRSGVMLYPAVDESFFMLTVQPPPRAEPLQVVPRELLFVVDVSGSMRGFPLDVSKQLLADLLAGMQPCDHFNVLVFAGGNAVMAEASVPATEANVARAASFVDEQTGGGGTELLPALSRALSMPRVEGASRTVVLATDGYVRVEKEAFELVRDSLGEANLFTFGIGSSVNRFLVEGLARAGGGEPAVVLGREQAGPRAAKFRRDLDSPVLTDVTVRYERFEVVDPQPTAVPDLFAGRPIVVLGRYAGEARGQIVVQGESATGPWEQAVDVGRGKLSLDNRPLRTLWARQAVARLSDDQRLAPDDARLAVVTALGLKYGLLTETTAFVAVDERIRAEPGGGIRVNHPSPMPRGVPDAAIGGCLLPTAADSMTGEAVVPAPGLGVGRLVMHLDKGGHGGYGAGGGAWGYGSGGGGFGAKGSGTIRTVDGDPIVLGALDRDGIDRVVKQHLAEIRYCYQRMLQQDWDLAGRVLFRFVIGQDGAVVSAEVVDSDLGNPVVEDCVRGRLMRLHFPPPDGGGIVVVTYPLVFSPTEE